jgi:hypothetical protein
VDTEKNEVKGYFKPPLDISSLLRFLLKWMMIKALEKKGSVFIHGSGVEKDGESLFFIGPSGSGKTSTLITLLLNGYRLITDDTILFKDGKVMPFHIRSKILKDLVQKVPSLENKLPNYAGFADSSLLINLGELFPRHESPVQPSKLFYVYVWKAEETRIEKVQKKEMLSRLFHTYQTELLSSLWFNQNKKETLREIFPLYKEFVEKTECYKIYAGTDQIKFIKAIQVR